MIILRAQSIKKCTRYDWPVKKAIVHSPIIKLKGISKCTSNDSLSSSGAQNKDVTNWGQIKSATQAKWEPANQPCPQGPFPSLWRWKPGKRALGTRLPGNKDIFCGKAWRFRLSVSMFCFLLCFCLFWIFPLFAASFSFFLNLPFSFLFHFGLFHSCCFM